MRRSAVRFRSAAFVSGCGSVWLERRVRDAEAASSNLVTPTYDEALGNIRFSRVFHFVFNN